MTFHKAADAGAHNAVQLRRLNLERLLAVVVDQASSFTRAELMALTGLSAPTVGSLVADLRGEPLAHDVIATPSRMAPETLLKHLAGALRGLMRGTGLPEGRLIAVGAGAPGAVEVDKGVVTEAPNLRNWSRVPMREIL